MSKKKEFGLHVRKFRLIENKSLFEDGCGSLEVSVFIEPSTGEIRLYLQSVVNKRGTDAILKELNK